MWVCVLMLLTNEKANSRKHSFLNETYFYGCVYCIPFYGHVYYCMYVCVRV